MAMYNEEEIAKIVEMLQKESQKSASIANQTGMQPDIASFVSQAGSNSRRGSQQHNTFLLPSQLASLPVVIDRMMQQPTQQQQQQPVLQPPLSQLLTSRNQNVNLDSSLESNSIYSAASEKSVSESSVRSDSSGVVSGGRDQRGRLQSEQPRIMSRNQRPSVPITEDHRYHELRQKLHGNAAQLPTDNGVEYHLKWTPTDSSGNNSCSGYSSISSSNSTMAPDDKHAKYGHRAVTPNNNIPSQMPYPGANNAVSVINQKNRPTGSKLSNDMSGTPYHQMLFQSKSDGNIRTNPLASSSLMPADTQQPPPLPPHKNANMTAPPRPSQPPLATLSQLLAGPSEQSLNTSAQNQSAASLNNPSLQQYLLKRQIETANQINQLNQSSGAPQQQQQQQQQQQPQSPSYVSSRPNAFSYASSGSSSSPQHGTSPISFAINPRLRAAATAASGQHHSGASANAQNQINPGNESLTTSELVSQVMQKLQSLNFASFNENPYSSSPPSYAASSSSGRQSTTPTISSSSDYASVPIIPSGRGPMQLSQQRSSPHTTLQSVHRKPSISPVRTSPLVTSQGSLVEKKSILGSASMVNINSALGPVTHGVATMPTGGDMLSPNDNSMVSQNCTDPNQSQSMQPCSIRKAVTHNPVIMQSVKSHQIQKPILQNAVAPILPPIVPPSPVSSIVKSSSSSTSSKSTVRPNVQNASMSLANSMLSPLTISSNYSMSIAQGGQSGANQQVMPSSIYSASPANVSSSNIPSPTSSTTSKSSLNNPNKNPPPPYSSVLGRPGSSCSSNSATSLNISNNNGPNNYHSTPPPPYPSSLQSNNQLNVINYQKLGQVSHNGQVVNNQAPPPPPPPAYPISLTAHQQDTIAQIISNFTSPPASAYGGSNSSAHSSSTANKSNSQQVQVPTTDPPSYASSMAALAAQRNVMAGHGATVSTSSAQSAHMTSRPCYSPCCTGYPQSVPSNPMANRPLPLPPTNQLTNSDLVNTVESICNSQISALQSGGTNHRGTRGLPVITDSTVPPLPPKPSVNTDAQVPPPVHQYRHLASESAIDSNINQSSSNLLNMSKSASIVETRRNSAVSKNVDDYDEVEGNVEEGDKQTHHSPIPIRRNLAKSSERSEYKVKNYSPAAYKFYMEQHFENLKKSQEQREIRRQQLESEMSKLGLTEEAQSEMRRMLYQKESNYIRLRRAKMDRSMFKKIKTIGVGAFGEVALVRKKDAANMLYAMKTLRKTDVLLRNQVAHVKAERDILAEADNEWVVKLYFSFQDAKNLYFVMDYIPGGDLMSLLIKLKWFDEALAQFYIAELVLAVESVHSMGFIHRDIKPDNILIDKDGHIKLTDFGLCTGFRWTHNSKYYHEKANSMDFDAANWPTNCQCEDKVDGNENDSGKAAVSQMNLSKANVSKPLERRNHRRQHHRCEAHSLVGTPNYIAPEVLMRIGYTKQCDWWSVGVIFYEMVVGSPPFYAHNPEETQQKVINWRTTLRIPTQAGLSPETCDLITKLCCDAQNRIGAEEIKRHAFFKGINFESVFRSQRAPYVPEIKHPMDTSNFDPIDPSMLHSDGSESEYEAEMYDDYGAPMPCPAPIPGGMRPPKNKDKQIPLSDPKHPHHAFLEFTFRRFFDSSGNAFPIKLATVTNNELKSSRNETPASSPAITDNESMIYGSFVSETTGSQVSGGDMYDEVYQSTVNSTTSVSSSKGHNSIIDQNGNKSPNPNQATSSATSTISAGTSTNHQNGDQTRNDKSNKSNSSTESKTSNSNKSTDPNGNNLVFV